MKLTKRKGFNFFRSYYDVYNELENDSDKVAFIEALLDRQFLGVKPTDLKGMAKFAYISQTNSIDSQVKGYEDKTGTRLTVKSVTPTQGGSVTPTEQVQEKVQEKVQVQEKGEYTPVDSQQNVNDIDFKQLLEFINNHTGKKYRVINKNTKQKYKARLKEGFTNTDIGNAIKNAVQIKYHKENGFQYLTPEFFSRADTINKYSQLNTKENGTSEKKSSRTLADKWEQYKNKSAGHGH